MANRAILADEEAMVTLTITGAVEMNEMTIEIAAGMESGTATVQVLDDMEVAPMADITIVATGSGIATPQTFTISVTEDDSARTFTLSGPDDMNLVEGMEYELTVTADPAVSADTEVMIVRDRAASTAGDDDYEVASAMIMAGETSGTTMLSVTEDGMDDSGAHMNEVLVLFAMADNTQSNSLEFNIWDAAVPALPVIAQLLLAALPGHRRLPPVSSAVAFGGGVRNSLAPSPLLPSGGRGGVSFDDFCPRLPGTSGGRGGFVYLDGAPSSGRSREGTVTGRMPPHGRLCSGRREQRC